LLHAPRPSRFTFHCLPAAAGSNQLNIDSNPILKTISLMAHVIEHPALPALKAKFPQIKFLAAEFRGMVTVVVPRENLLEVATFLRDDFAQRYEMLAEVNGVDYLNYPGAEHRFAVNYGLTSVSHNTRLWLKVFFDPERETGPGTAVRDEKAIADGDPGLKVDSLTAVWAGAEWLEREVYDMLGIIFVGHPDLRRILTWNGFGSHPHRKDYPLRGVGERENYKIVTREGA
jgi:NADH-quinone oxidoreductase subunit C